MKRIRKALPVDEAIRKVVEACPPGKVEEIDLFDCYHRVLAEDILASHSVPFFNRSAMDGFAISSSDSIGATREKPKALKVVDRLAAGDVARVPVTPGHAIRIMTGAAMPEGANAVVMLEKVTEKETFAEKWIEFYEEIEPGKHVSQIGEDLTKGELVVAKGTRISEGDLALLATFGSRRVAVQKQPVIGIYATGAELLQVEEALQPGKIRNSNSVMIMGQVRKYGGVPKLLGIIPDRKEEAVKAIGSALSEVDMIVTTGGVSVGDYDLMLDVYEELGADFIFDRVAMRPGKPTTVAAVHGKLIFGLSGNPAACFVGFELFAKPALLSYQGFDASGLDGFEATIAEDFSSQSPFLTFIRAIAYIEHGIVKVMPMHKNRASMLSSLGQSNCFILVQPGSVTVQENEKVQILLFAPFAGREESRFSIHWI
ncbi:gephyrin-like molybdotransferase Glp [Ammoniphilus resinae]|uniref:Molybdopterin molybdenumtransferase n=1 Tax=Ammoniphilus resinae TaxID=861532 RepID=A0ABS4GR33_9BACL|nr:gephyrin-like molybdotransferase Glp [Ammoniphilus resinae]MBP1932694.1 molybdopterin molybdotransferase [Ammoniphilus resinae]